MKSTSWSTGLSVSGDGVGVVAHAGGAAVRLLADQVGLTSELSGALTRRGFVPGHDRGQVLVDVATMLAGGGEAIADIDTLRPGARCAARRSSRKKWRVPSSRYTRAAPWKGCSCPEPAAFAVAAPVKLSELAAG